MLTVSNYHYIRKDFEQPFPSIFGLTPEQFKSQLTLMHGQGEFISPENLLLNYEDIITSKQNYFLITFDDGLKEQFELAKPILDDFGIQALYFINSINYIEKKVSLVHKTHLVRSQIDSSQLLSFFEKQSAQEIAVSLTKEEKNKAIAHYNYDEEHAAYLKYLLNFKWTASQQDAMITPIFEQMFDEKKVVETLYMTIEQLEILGKEKSLGSHTHSHIALGIQSEEKISEEIHQTNTFLESLLGQKIKYISYPYGSKEACTTTVFEAAQKAGHSIGFTMERGINDNLSLEKLALKRFDCNDVIGGKNYKK